MNIKKTFSIDMKIEFIGFASFEEEKERIPDGYVILKFGFKYPETVLFKMACDSSFLKSKEGLEFTEYEFVLMCEKYENYLKEKFNEIH